jgi:uncharacterized membrane protein (UPF0182 family)
MTRSRGFGLAIAILVASLILLALASDFLVDWTWFSSVGFLEVFWTIIGAKLALFAAVFLATAIIVCVNGSLAARAVSPRSYLRPVGMPWDSLRNEELPAVLERFLRHLPWRLLVPAISVVVAILVALGWLPSWNLVLNFLFQAPYGRSDPLFGNDISFYLFSLPALVALKDWMVLVLVLSALLAAVIYWSGGEIAFDARRRYMSPAAATHFSILLGLFFAVEAWAFILARYLLLYGDNGVVVGAGYSDVHVTLPILTALALLCGIAAIAAFANVRLRSTRILLASAALIFGTSFLLSPLAAALFQRIYVKPNELQLEQPYIGRNIALTREAYNLRNVVVKPFSEDQSLTYQSLQDNRATIDNIRLWDWQPLLDTYAQLQEIRTYYKFHDADIDRYSLGGSDQQVMLSARELESTLLPANAQTWVNLHVLFTHGNGVVMSPVTRTTPEGLPVFYLQDIPPIASGGPAVSEPRIYFGEGNAPYVIVKGSAPEFDYPRGNDNVYRAYDGADGVPIGGFARRTLFAWYFGDLNILLSQYVTAQSRIVIRRNIQERVSAIAPFLTLDHDPYVVVSGGRLYWIQDAYTTSSWFPYAQPLDGDTNYIRNSVKVVIDAYNGNVDFYISDPADPIIATYRRIFPTLFKPFGAMPADLQKHTRYPEDLFLVQAQIYRTYHMNAPEVFYNREDLWDFPRQPGGLDDTDAADSKMAPYYINMRLPGETHTEFVLMLPMVPSQRENMIAWLAARCDAPDYGKLIVYEFPKDKLVYGPYQIEALINQNTEVSQQLTLWNQSGSRVIRGNLLVVPIENSILYVTPLYLRAQSGQLPELKRVIAIYGGRVVMEETLADALAALFNAPPPAAAASAVAPQAASVAAGPLADRAREALAHYDRAIAKLKAGDWSGFGAELDALRPLLQQLNQPSGGH